MVPAAVVDRGETVCTMSETAGCHSGQGSSASTGTGVADLIAAYKQAATDVIASDPEFARWLDEEYAPLAGGWHY